LKKLEELELELKLEVEVEMEVEMEMTSLKANLRWKSWEVEDLKKLLKR